MIKRNFNSLMIISAILISSCTTVLDQKIESESIELNVKKIKIKYPELDSLKLDLMDGLVRINKGRDAFVKELESKSEDSEFSISKFVVDEEKFNTQKDNIFNYFKAQEITFAQLFAEVDTVNNINERFEKEAQEIFIEIDKFCNVKQQEIGEKKKKADEIKTKLNEMVDLKIISIRETERDYRDNVEVEIQMTNKTSIPVEAISFNMELIDKLGNKLATLRCRSNDRFVKSDVGYWTFDRWDNNEIYKALQNTKLSHITTKQEITKINHGGELISAYGDIDELLVINFDYKTPNKLIGYCPYLEDEDDLSVKLKDLESKKEKSIEKSTPIVNKFQEFASKLLDVSGMIN